MVLRTWKGRARFESADAYLQHVTGVVFPTLRQLPGYLRGRVFRRSHEGRVEFLVATEWASWDAIRAFAGDDMDRAVVEPEAQAILSDFDRRVEHFELVHDSASGG